MIKAIFFDLDETLIDAIEPHTKAQRMIFDSLGIDYEEIDKRTKHHDFTGMRVIDILEIQRDAMEISEEKLPLSRLSARREEFFLELVEKEVRLLTGAKKALKIAKEKNKIVAIVSSGTRRYIQLVLKMFKLEDFVDFFISEEDVTKGKPNPDCYLKAFERLPKEKKIRKEECLVVEDSPKGVQAANKAGIPVCFVPLFTSKENFTYQIKLKSLKQFPDILK